jgi:hypothetical protein
LILDDVIERFSITVENFSSETNLFWRVRVRNSEGFGPWSAVRNFTVDPFEAPTEVTAVVTRTFGDSAYPPAYRLVALPGQINESLASLLDGNAGVDWQAFWDNGSDKNFLVKDDGSKTLTMETGNGFWVTSTGSFEFNQTLDAVDLNADRQTVIPLHDGWNIISNPLDIDVPWSAVVSANSGTIQSAWGFEGSFEEMSDFVSA